MDRAVFGPLLRVFWVLKVATATDGTSSFGATESRTFSFSASNIKVKPQPLQNADFQ